METTLGKYKKYSREQIYKFFSRSERKFEPKGAWGLWGIMRIPGTKENYIFYVTLNLKNGVYSFDEGISDEGVLTWQSQHKQTLEDKTIIEFINHDESVNNIYLFVRPNKKNPQYTYLGNLAYVSHDMTKECPVHFKWRILDWNRDEAFSALGILDIKINSNVVDKLPPAPKLVLVSKPVKTANSEEKDNMSFFSSNIDFKEEQIENDVIGKMGEELSMKFEKEYLIHCGRFDLASKVKLTRDTQGNNAPYDILSYDPFTGKEKYIEVKTTKGDIRTPFFISERESKFSEIYCSQYYLYRVFEFDMEKNCGKLYVENGFIDNYCNKTPVKYKCEIN